MIKYTLYIGLNDRDTEVSLDINKSISIINKYFKDYKYTYFIASGMSTSLEHWRGNPETASGSLCRAA